MRRYRMLGGDLHPFYRAILLRGLGLGYELPSMDCQRLQNTLVKNLAGSIIWDRLDSLFVHAVHGGATLFTGINWIVPTMATTSFSTTSWVSKKGIHHGGAGSCTYPITMLNRVKMTDTIDCMFFFMLGLAGGAITQIESMMQCSGTNTQLLAMRLRTNPRVDYVFNGTPASVVMLQDGLPVTGRLYTIDKGTGPTGSTFTTWFGGTKQNEIVGGGGVLPDSNNFFSQSIASSRALAFCGTGGGLANFGGAFQNGVALLNTYLTNYFNALQTLP